MNHSQGSTAGLADARVCLPRSRAEPHDAPSSAVAGKISMERIGVAIVDDDGNDRSLMQRILNHTQRFYCVGEYSTGEAALVGIPQSTAKIVLMDVRMPGMSGIECSRRLRAFQLNLVIVMVTGLDDQRTSDLVRAAGAKDYLLKPFSVGQFLATLTLSLPQRRTNSGVNRLQLTSQASELLRHLDEGLLYNEIADRLHISEPTVRGLISELYLMMEVSNRTEAVNRWRDQP